VSATKNLIRKKIISRDDYLHLLFMGDEQTTTKDMENEKSMCTNRGEKHDLNTLVVFRRVPIII
jgi:hypothetical protein